MNIHAFQNFIDPAGINRRAEIIIIPGINLADALFISCFFVYILISIISVKTGNILINIVYLADCHYNYSYLNASIGFLLAVL